MERVNRILKNPQYLSALEKIADCERERMFCKHDLDHFLSVARIMYIHSLENDLNLEKDIIYATSILHDIGRHIEYTDGIPHEIASLSLSEEILLESGFSEKEQSRILYAISKHNLAKEEDKLTNLLQWADHLSRNCFNCHARSKCKWSEEEKNMEVLL